MYEFFKRCFDLLFAIFFLIVFSPVYFITWLVIKIVSPGPAIYKAERVGKGGKMFKCYKFRSMRVDSGKVRLTTLENDDRIFPFGKFIRKAKIDEMHREILDFKINRKKNSEIAATINKKYGKSYTDNYISTIFTQKVIKGITDAARQHEEFIANLPFIENFKICNCCKKILLKSPDNFVRKANASDGFTNRCKRCDRLKRQGGKK